MAAPAWQTEELGEEWIETTPSPPTTPALTENVVRGSIHNKRGSLRSLGHGSAARALPPGRKGSTMSLPDGGRSESNPYIRNASGMLSPPTSASSDDGRDGELNKSYASYRSVSAPASSIKGTFVVKEGEESHGKAFPKNPFSQAKDMFEPLPLERMFEPPSPPKPIPEEEEPIEGSPSTSPVHSPPRSMRVDHSHTVAPTSDATPERSIATAAALPATSPRDMSPHSPFSFGSTPSSGSDSRRVSHSYAPAQPSRLSKSMTPSDNSFSTATANSSRAPSPPPDGEEDMSLIIEDDSRELPAVPNDTAEGPTHPYDETGPTHQYDHTGQPTIPYDDNSSHDQQNRSDSASPQTGTQRIRELQSGEFETDLPGQYPFTFTAPVGEPARTENLDRERSETPIFEPSLAPLPGGEPSHSTLRTRPPSTNLGIRLFRNTYDTVTREHLSALVDSIGVAPSPPNGNSLPRQSNLRDWSPEATGSPAYRSASDSSTPESITSDSRSSKRIRLSLSAPRGPAVMRDWRAQGHAMLERIRVTDPDMSLTSASGSRDSQSGRSSGAWSFQSGSEAREVPGPTVDYGEISSSPDPEPKVKSNPSTASSNYLHRAEGMLREIKSRGVSPTSTRTTTTNTGSRASERILSETSLLSSSVNTSGQSSEAESHIPRHDFSQKGKAREISPAETEATETRSSSRGLSVEGAGRPLNREDLNRFVSATTAATATTMSTSFVKHPGPRDPTHRAPMTMIRLDDVQEAIPERYGKMRFDPATSTWVRRDSLTRLSEAGESGRGSEDSADPFAGFDTTSPSIDASQLQSSPEKQALPLSPLREGSVLPPRPESRASRRGFPDASTSSPEKYALSSPEKSSASEPEEDVNATPRARPRLGQSYSAPPGGNGTPQPLRSALRNPNNMTPVSAMKKRAAWHTDLTPAREREASAAPSSGSAKRSVSFSDGYVIAQHLHAERAEWSRRDRDGSLVERVEHTYVEEGSSCLPSLRTRRIQADLDRMADLSIADSDDGDMPDPSPSKPARPSSFSRAPSVPRVEEVSENETDKSDASDGYEDDSTVPITGFRSFGGRSFRRAGDQTFLTECSFGVAHDRLVQLITDVQPFEPHWEELRSIDLSNKGVESLARLKEFLPRLDSAYLNDNAIDYLSGVPSTVRTLHVAGNRLSSLTSVNHLRNLHLLDLSRNCLDSVSQLDCLHHLRELVLDDNAVTDLGGIMDIDCLVKLSVAGNALTHLDFTDAKWEHLETLDLSRNQIKSIRGLEKLRSLTTLKLDSNFLVALEPAKPMTNLRILRVSDNGLTSLDVSLFPRLRTLFADNNAIPSLSRSAAGGHRIENLSLRNQDVEAFRLLPEDIQAAKRLYVSGNRLDPHFLSTPVYSLVYLEAAACQLNTWPANLARYAPNLRVLNVNYNFIEDLDGLAGLTRLHKLMAVSCRLGARENAARALKDLDNLVEVDMRMNPFTLSLYLPIMVPSPQNGKREKGGKGGNGEKGERREKEDESRGAVPDNDKWPAQDAAYRKQLPDEWYARRLTYRGLVFAACPRLCALDGIKITEGERTKAAQLIESAQR